MLIDDIGTGYANENLSGSYFMHNGTVYRVMNIGRFSMSVWNLGSNSEDSLPTSIFSGWRGFKFPRLGYRKLSNGMVCWLQRQARTYSRGIGRENLIVTPTANTLTRTGLDAHDLYDVFDEEFDYVGEAALSPVYDSRASFQRIQDSSNWSFVPAYNVLMEQDGTGFKVYHQQTLLGKVDGDVITANPRNRNIITKLVNRYAS